VSYKDLFAIHFPSMDFQNTILQDVGIIVKIVSRKFARDLK